MIRGEGDQPTASYQCTYPSHPRIKHIRRAPRASTDSRHSDCVPPDCPRVFHRRTHGTNGPRPLRSGARCEPCGRRRCAAARRSARRARGARREPRKRPGRFRTRRRGGDARGEGDASSQSIRVVDSDDEPAGWPGTDPCTSDDGAARTSTSAFAEGCVAVDAREVARSIAAELLTKRARSARRLQRPALGRRRVVRARLLRRLRVRPGGRDRRGVRRRYRHRAGRDDVAARASRAARTHSKHESLESTPMVTTNVGDDAQ